MRTIRVPTDATELYQEGVIIPPTQLFRAGELDDATRETLLGSAPWLDSVFTIVSTVDEAFNMPGKPYLYLNLTTHNTGIELYSYSIRIELNQDVGFAFGRSAAGGEAEAKGGALGRSRCSRRPARPPDAAM